MFDMEWRCISRNSNDIEANWHIHIKSFNICFSRCNDPSDLCRSNCVLGTSKTFVSTCLYFNDDQFLILFGYDVQIFFPQCQSRCRIT